MMVGVLVLPEVMVGITEASMTRSLSKPITRKRASTTANGSDSMPIFAVPTGFALTGVFVVKTKAGDVGAAATGASQSGVTRVAAIEAPLKANWSAAALDSVKIPASGLMSDIHGSADYRANLIKVMAQRAVTQSM